MRPPGWPALLLRAARPVAPVRARLSGTLPHPQKAVRATAVIDGMMDIMPSSKAGHSRVQEAWHLLRSRSGRTTSSNRGKLFDKIQIPEPLPEPLRSSVHFAGRGRRRLLRRKPELEAGNAGDLLRRCRQPAEGNPHLLHEGGRIQILRLRTRISAGSAMLRRCICRRCARARSSRTRRRTARRRSARTRPDPVSSKVSVVEPSGFDEARMAAPNRPTMNVLIRFAANAPQVLRIRRGAGRIFR